MNELALFAGIGGGILAGIELGWRTRCAVEIDPYARRALLARQLDGSLARFPIWDDIRTFDGAHGVASKGRYRQAVIQRCAEIGWSPSAEMQEALMGIPIGWTACAPSATLKSRPKPRRRSACSMSASQPKAID